MKQPRSSINYYSEGDTNSRNNSYYTNTSGEDSLTSVLKKPNFFIGEKERSFFLPISNFHFFPEIDSPIFKTDIDVIEIKSLESENYELKRPLLIEVSKENDEFKVELPQLELYAFSDKEEEAVEELIEDFIDLCDVIFSSHENVLSYKVKLWKEFILSYVNVNEK